MLLKANIDVAGWPATAGFYGLRDSVAPQDAEQTRRLRRAGGRPRRAPNADSLRRCTLAPGLTLRRALVMVPRPCRQAKARPQPKPRARA